MREALGMSSETSSKEAIKNLVIRRILSLGTGVVNKKLPSDLKKRQELLQTYKSHVSKLRKNLRRILKVIKMNKILKIFLFLYFL